MTLNSGTRLGNCEIVAPLGAGRMCEVYRSRDTRLNRDVAVKVVSAGMAKDPVEFGVRISYGTARGEADIWIVEKT